MRYHRLLALFCVMGLCVQAGADYMIIPLGDGADSLEIAAGDSFDLDIVLDSDASDDVISAIFRVEFSRDGLCCESYQWASPFSTGSIDDQSVPGCGGQPLPIILDEDVLSGLGYPAAVVDVELSNVTDSGLFPDGTLVTLSLLVPAEMSLGAVIISIIPDTLDNGMVEVPTLAGADFTLTVVPEPATLTVLLIGVSGLLARRKRGSMGTP